jgi:hypothetical protein
MGTSCVVCNKHTLGRMWSRILQVRVHFAWYFRMPKDSNPETYTLLQKYMLKYSAVSGKMKLNLNISWSHYNIGLKPIYFYSFDKVPYFVCTLRLMFSCNLRIMFIRQRNEFFHWESGEISD